MRRREKLKRGEQESEGRGYMEEVEGRRDRVSRDREKRETEDMVK